MAVEALVITDPQNDFCHPEGSLYVPGAAEDMARLAEYVKRKGADVSGIFVSMDTHDRVAIFHPAFWRNAEGRHPDPFTPLSPEDFRSGKWRVASPANEAAADRTFSVMEARGIDSLMVWPEHCIVSTWGHQIAEPLHGVLSAWSETTGLAVRYVFKGENPWTDQFSMFEGVDDTYPETAFNESFFARLSAFDRVTFAGEALSHCVQESVLSYMRRLGGAKQAVRLLVDCTSPVGGFDGNASLELLRRSGVEFATAEDIESK